MIVLNTEMNYSVQVKTLLFVNRRRTRPVSGQRRKNRGSDNTVAEGFWFSLLKKLINEAAVREEM